MMGAAPGFKRLREVLEELNIPFMIGGSIASCIHGIPRSTHDVDLVADFRPEHIQRFCAALSSEFYADPVHIQESLRHGTLFTLVHFATSFKFDIFPLSSKPFDQSQFARRFKTAYSFDGQETLQVPVASAEDTVLMKLVWYRMGGQVSDRQWSDIRDIIRVQRERLDRGYLDQWAGPLGVEDLLVEALQAAQPPKQ